MQSWTSLLGVLLAAFVFTGTPFIISIMSSVYAQHCQLLYPQENIKHYSRSKFRYPSWLEMPWIFLGFSHLAWHLASVSLLQNKQWLCGRGESLSKHLGLGQQVVQNKQDNNGQLWFSVNRCHSYIYLPFLPYLFIFFAQIQSWYVEFNTQSFLRGFKARKCITAVTKETQTI